MKNFHGIVACLWFAMAVCVVLIDAAANQKDLTVQFFGCLIMSRLHFMQAERGV